MLANLSISPVFLNIKKLAINGKQANLISNNTFEQINEHLICIQKTDKMVLYICKLTVTQYEYCGAKVLNVHLR